MSKPLPGQKKIVTVWLESEVEGMGDRLKMFFCYNCRIPTVQYRGSVITIVPGSQPYKAYTLLKCKGNVQKPDSMWEECGMYYSFAGTVYGVEK